MQFVSALLSVLEQSVKKNSRAQRQGQITFAFPLLRFIISLLFVP